MYFAKSLDPLALLIFISSYKLNIGSISHLRKLKLKNIRYLTQGHAVKKELKTGF